MKKERSINNQELSKYADKLRVLIKNIVESLGFSLSGVTFTNEHGENYLRVTIEHNDYPISLNDCEIVSRKVEKELDLKDPIPFSYTLEVQSPGIGDVGKDKLNAKEDEHEFIIDNLGLILRS